MARTPSVWVQFSVVLSLIVFVIGSLVTGAADAATTVTARTGTCSIAGRAVRGPDDWVAMSPPAFSVGGPTLVDFAVDRRQPNRVFVTNGQVIARSLDGGCSFEEVFLLPASGESAATHTRDTSQISQLEVTPEGVFATLTGVGLPRPALMKSPDGESWNPAGDGLPVAGVARELVAAPSEPGTMYLTIDVGPGVSVLYSSSDAGGNWSPAVDITDLDRGGEKMPSVIDLAVDPAEPESLWAATPSGLVHSSDGGGSWSSDPSVAFPFSTVLVTRVGGGGPTIFGFRSEGDFLVYRSDDGGGAWRVLRGPSRKVAFEETNTSDPRQAAVASATLSATGEVIAAMPLRSSVHRLDNADDRWKNLTIGRPILRDVTSDIQGAIWALGDLGLYRYDQPRQGAGGSPFKLPGYLYCLLDSDAEAISQGEERSFLSPVESVVLEEGESKTIPYQLDLRSAPVLLDVFFLLDTSKSMDDIMCSLARSLASVVTEVSPIIPNIRLGLGEYNNHNGFARSASDSGDAQPDVHCLHTYNRRVALSPPSGRIARVLQRMPTCGGYEPALIALDEAVMGDGRDLLPYGINDSYDLPAGQGAGWREGPGNHLRVVVHATDEVIQGFDDSPDPDEVIATLREKDVLHVGISGRAVADDGLRYLSAGSGAFASGDGVDCDGDELVDLRSGDPLVCPMYHGSDALLSLTPALVDIFEGFSLVGDIAFSVDDFGKGVAGDATPDAIANLDFRRRHLLPFAIRFECPQVPRDTIYPVEVGASTAGRVIDSVFTNVECLDRPGPSSEPATVVLPPPPPPIPPLPRPPQPQPHVQANAQPNPQTQPQGQGQQQAQVQAGLVTQHQEQPQVAAVKVGKPNLNVVQEGGSAHEDLSFTRYRKRKSLPPYLPSYVIASVLGAAFGIVVRRRSQVRPVTTSIDRRLR